MRLTEIQLRRTIRSILNELLTRRKGKKSWLQHGLEQASGETAFQHGAYDVDVGMDEADEGEEGEDSPKTPAGPGGDDDLNKDYDD